jgi:hypothetical protein
MKSARSRANGVLLGLLSIGFSCLLLGAVDSSRSCCPDASSCQAMLSAGCCAPSSNIPSVPSAGPPALLVDRFDHDVPLCVAAPRVESIGRISAAALGIRTTVLRL